MAWRRADADHVDVVFDGLACNFGGRAEQRAEVDVEAEVGEGRGDDFGPRSWPSCPIFATRMRGRRPARAANASLRARTLS